jgi:hypothetical protein
VGLDAMKRNRRLFENRKRREAASVEFLDKERRRTEDRLTALETHAASHVHTDVMIGGSDTGLAYIPETEE